MPAEAEYLVQKLGAEAVHDRHHDNEGCDAKHDADERKPGYDGNESLAAARAEIAEGEHPLKARKGFGIVGDAVHGAAKCAEMPSSGTLLRSPVRRFFTSATPSLRPRGPMMSCVGRPIRSISLNLAPGRSSVSS